MTDGVDPPTKLIHGLGSLTQLIQEPQLYAPPGWKNAGEQPDQRVLMGTAAQRAWYEE